MGATQTHHTDRQPAIEPEDQSLDELRCLLCGDVIGVYEPLVACEDSHGRTTSRAAEPDLGTAGGTYYHRGCYSRRS